MSYLKCKGCGKKLDKKIKKTNKEKKCPHCGSNRIVKVIKSDNAGDIEFPL